MEIPTKEDFDRLERKLTMMLSSIIDLVEDKNEKYSMAMILNVKDVEVEFKCSPHLQRIARDNGRLVYKKIGREIQYTRGDIQKWVDSTLVKY